MANAVIANTIVFVFTMSIGLTGLVVGECLASMCVQTKSGLDRLCTWISKPSPETPDLRSARLKLAGGGITRAVAGKMFSNVDNVFGLVYFVHKLNALLSEEKHADVIATMTKRARCMFPVDELVGSPCFQDVFKTLTGRNLRNGECAFIDMEYIDEWGEVRNKAFHFPRINDTSEATDSASSDVPDAMFRGGSFLCNSVNTVIEEPLLGSATLEIKFLTGDVNTTCDDIGDLIEEAINAAKEDEVPEGYEEEQKEEESEESKPLLCSLTGTEPLIINIADCSSEEDEGSRHSSSYGHNGMLSVPATPASTPTSARSENATATDTATATDSDEDSGEDSDAAEQDVDAATQDESVHDETANETTNEDEGGCETAPYIMTYETNITPVCRAWISSQKEADFLQAKLPFILRDFAQVDPSVLTVFDTLYLVSVKLNLAYTDGQIISIEINEEGWKPLVTTLP